MANILRWIPLSITLCIALFTAYTLSTSALLISGQTKEQHLNHPPYEKNRTDTDTDGVRRFLLGVIWNVLLVALFVTQHSGMASDWWKSHVHIFRSFGIERMVYIIASNFLLLVLFNNWMPLQVTPLWYIDTSDRFWLWLFFTIFHVVMWIAIYGASLCADIAELLGYTEFYNYWNGIDKEPHANKTLEMQRLLRHMRHPGTTCFLLILWVHPLMTWQRFICSLSLTLYVLFGFSVTDEDHVYAKRSWYRKTFFVMETTYVQIR